MMQLRVNFVMWKAGVRHGMGSGLKNERDTVFREYNNIDK